MRKRSVFLHAVSAMMRDMMKKDKWAEKYNPYQLFKVNQYDYNTLGEYLDALREKWKDEADPYGECDDYVDVSHYRDFNSYESEVDMYLERGRWRRNDYDYGRYNVNPMDYETEEDYLKALSLKVREDYDPLDDFPALEPMSFDSLFDYDYAIEERWGWKVDHDPADECDIDPGAYEYEDDYVDALNEWKKSKKSHGKVPFVHNVNSYTHKAKKQMSRKRTSKPKSYLVDIEENPTEEDKQSWEEKHNSYNIFSSVDPTQYDHEKDYLDELRKQWKEYYDPTEMYDVNPQDYDTEEDYMEAIKMYIKSKYR